METDALAVIIILSGCIIAGILYFVHCRIVSNYKHIERMEAIRLRERSKLEKDYQILLELRGKTAGFVNEIESELKRLDQSDTHIRYVTKDIKNTLNCIKCDYILMDKEIENA